MAAAVWFILAVLLGAAEVATLTLALGMGAVSAGAAGVAALLGAPVAGQGAVFAGALALLLLGVRPIARRHLETRGSQQSGTAALLGQQARVTIPVGDAGGQVRLGGELWSARLALPGLVAEPLPAGTPVFVTSVDGASVVVSPLEV